MIEGRNEMSNKNPQYMKCVSCEYKPGLLSNIKQALEALHLMIMRAGIATLGGRMKNVFVIISCKEQNFEDVEYRQFLAGSVHRAFRSVLTRFCASQDILGTRERRGISIFSSSSFGDFLLRPLSKLFES